MSMPAAFAKAIMETCGIVPGPVEPYGILPGAAFAAATTSATDLYFELGAAISTTGLSTSLQTGSKLS